jgi:hypothetical protein
VHGQRSRVVPIGFYGTKRRISPTTLWLDERSSVVELRCLLLKTASAFLVAIRSFRRERAMSPSGTDSDAEPKLPQVIALPEHRKTHPGHLPASGFTKAILGTRRRWDGQR